MQRKLVFTLLFLGTFGIRAQDTATISGRVLDPSGAAVPGAVLLFSPRNAAPERQVTANAEGAFRAVVPVGAYLITARSPLFGASAPLAVDARGGQHEIDLHLEIEQLATAVQVIGAAVPQTVDEQAKALDVIRREDWTDRGEFSVAEAIRATPGLRVQQLGGPGSLTRVQVRGLRPFDTSVIVDGFRLRDVASPQGEASAFVGDLMLTASDRVEILRGSGSSLYGTNAEGGVVNIVTSQGGGKARGDISAEGGGLGLLRGAAQLSGGLANDRFRYSGGLAHLNVTGGVDGNDRYRNSSAQGSAYFDSARNFTVLGRLYAADVFGGLNSNPFAAAALPSSTIVPAVAGVTYTPSPDDPDSRRSARFTSVLTGFTHQATPGFGWRAAYQAMLTSRDNRDGPGGTRFPPLFNNSNLFDGRIDTLQIRADWYRSRVHSLTGGYEWERESFRNLSTNENPNPAARTNAQLRIAERSHSLYVQDQIRLLSERLLISLSGRTQSFDLDRPEFAGGRALYTGSVPSSPPRAWTGDASLAWMAPSTQTKFRAHAGNGYRAPALYERFGSSFFSGAFSGYGDPRLRPERLISADAGIDQYAASNRVRLSATYFYTRIQEAILFDSSGAITPATDPFGRFGGYRNSGGGLARGVEIEAEAAPWRSTRFNAAYTYTNSDERNPILLGGILRAINISDHVLTAVIAQRFSRRIDATFDLFAGSDYLFPLFDGRGSRAFQFPGTRKADLALNYTLPLDERRSLRFFTRIENVFNRSYYEDGFRTPGIWAVGGLRLLF